MCYFAFIIRAHVSQYANKLNLYSCNKILPISKQQQLSLCVMWLMTFSWKSLYSPAIHKYKSACSDKIRSLLSRTVYPTSIATKKKTSRHKRLIDLVHSSLPHGTRRPSPFISATSYDKIQCVLKSVNIAGMVTKRKR